MIKFAVGCVTYNRPHLLGEFVHSFLTQMYPASHRELIILDDAWQYGNVQGEGWQIVSFPRRFASLGEKRNACFAMASPDVDVLVVGDDDDIYMPWWLESHAENFERGISWSAADWFYETVDNENMFKKYYRGQFVQGHPSHAFEKTLFQRVGGYPPISGSEDQDLYGRFRRLGLSHSGTCGKTDPSFLIYRRFSSEKHMSGISLESYRNPDHYRPALPHAEMKIGWKRDYLSEIKALEEKLRSSGYSLPHPYFRPAIH